MIFSEINVNSFWNASKTCRLKIYITWSLFEFEKFCLENYFFTVRVISLNRSTFHLKFSIYVTRTVYKCWDYRATAVSVTRRIIWTGQLPPSSQDMAQDKIMVKISQLISNINAQFNLSFMNLWSQSNMWVNTLTGERFMLFDLVIAFFKFYTMIEGFFLCVLQLQFYKKKIYIKKT